MSPCSPRRRRSPSWNGLRKGSEDARGALRRSHMRLVVSIARQYLDQGSAFELLLTLGDERLRRAVDRIDPEKDLLSRCGLPGGSDRRLLGNR